MLLAILSAADAYILIVPNEALLVIGVLGNPKKWFRIGVWTTLGSAVGATSLAWLISRFGESWVSHISSTLTHSKSWLDAIHLIREFGAWGLALVSLSPFPQHAAVIIVGFAHLPMLHVFLAIMVGRSIKYLAVAWCSAHAPYLLVRWRIVPSALFQDSESTGGKTSPAK